MVQLVRVVDSSNNQYCLEAVTPTTDRRAVNTRHLKEDGTPTSALGRMMLKLVVRGPLALSHMIPSPPDVSASWCLVSASCFGDVEKHFATAEGVLDGFLDL
jgi:hypothetical protein